MSQTKAQSLRETLTNTFIGMAGSWVITWGTFQFLSDEVAITTVATILCTVWSITRGYTVRRYFNRQGAA